MIIAIHGQAGSGKSSISKLLARRLRYRHYSTGDFYRRIAKKRKMSLAQLVALSEKERWVDRETDDYQKELGEKRNDFVIDSRLGFHFIPRSFKVYLRADLDERARRIFMEKRGDETYASLTETRRMILRRQRSERLRYRRYYRLDIMDMKNYDLVIDTTRLTKKQIVDRIMEAIKKRE